ncbi:hypothetical protein ABTZ93_28125 [Streptomyces sp. NPDC097941]|uniref:hypothetical protein n=1 Tax=Streptomyces sp. NPDC097941 TaxID=3155685 RepID=UPI00332A1EB4
MGPKQDLLGIHTVESLRAGFAVSVKAPLAPAIIAQVRQPTVMFVGGDHCGSWVYPRYRAAATPWPGAGRPSGRCCGRLRSPRTPGEAIGRRLRIERIERRQ